MAKKLPGRVFGAVLSPFSPLFARTLGEQAFDEYTIMRTGQLPVGLDPDLNPALVGFKQEWNNSDALGQFSMAGKTTTQGVFAVDMGVNGTAYWLRGLGNTYNFAANRLPLSVGMRMYGIRNGVSAFGLRAAALPGLETVAPYARTLLGAPAMGVTSIAWGGFDTATGVINENPQQAGEGVSILGGCGGGAAVGAVVGAGAGALPGCGIGAMGGYILHSLPDIPPHYKLMTMPFIGRPIEFPNDDTIHLSNIAKWFDARGQDMINAKRQITADEKLRDDIEKVLPALQKPEYIKYFDNGSVSDTDPTMYAKTGLINGTHDGYVSVNEVVDQLVKSHMYTQEIGGGSQLAGQLFYAPDSRLDPDGDGTVGKDELLKAIDKYLLHHVKPEPKVAVINVDTVVVTPPMPAKPHTPTHRG